MSDGFIKLCTARMFVARVFIVSLVFLHTATRTHNAPGRKNLSDPCDDKTIVLETTLINGTIENRFRLGCTSTLFVMFGGSSSATWYATRPLVSDLWPEFFFFYEQSIVLRFIRILLGFEPVVMSLTCTFDLISKNYSFSLRVDDRSFGACTVIKTYYTCSAGRMTEFFKNLERYKGGRSIVKELKDHVKALQHKWLGVCKRFDKLEANATHIYSLTSDSSEDTITCSVSSSVPWKYLLRINESVINDTETTYNRSDDMHTTVGSVLRKGGMRFICNITSPNGTIVSEYVDIPPSPTPTSLVTTTEEYHVPLTTGTDATTETRKKSVKKVVMTQKEIPTFGPGPVSSVVIMVSIAIVLMGSFIFREELVSVLHKLNEVPTESPYKDIVMTIEG